MKIIASKESEYSTRFLTQGKSGGYFVGVKNGGSLGSHQPRNQNSPNPDWGFWIEPLRIISEAEAEALAYEINEIALPCTPTGGHSHHSVVRMPSAMPPALARSAALSALPVG